MKLVLLLTFALATSGAYLITGCSGSDSVAADSGSGGGNSTSEEVTVTSPLYILVSTQYDGTPGEGTPVLSHGLCNIDPDNLAANNITCNITIPEGLLFYSKMFLTVGTGRKDLCPRVEFYPYYRKFSTNAAYIPPGADATQEVDCSLSSTVAGCYNGAQLI